MWFQLVSVLYAGNSDIVNNTCTKKKYEQSILYLKSMKTKDHEKCWWIFKSSLLVIRKYRYKQTIKQNLRKFACTQKTTEKNWVNKTEQYQDKWLFQVDWLLAKKAKSLH
jgi:hypothetical protein